MADRERLTVSERVARLPILHLTIGLATLFFVFHRQPREGGSLAFYAIADRMGQGLIPYLDFSVEYPPLGLLHLYLPRLVAGQREAGYEWAFTFLSFGLALATAAVVYFLARRGWSLNSTNNTMLIFLSLSLASLPLIVWRFDILPTLFTAVALAAFATGRNGSTGAALGLGTLAKLYPAFLGPVFFFVRVFERRFAAAAALVAGAALTVGVVFIGLYLTAGLDAFSYVLYQDERGVEIESVAGGLALLADAYGIAGARIFFDFGSYQVASGVLGRLETPLTLFNWAIALAVIGSAAWQFRDDVRSTGTVRPATVVTFVVATLLVVILTNKVLSPQYVVWLLPFGSLLRARQALLLVVIFAVTTLIYPMGFQTLLQTEQSIVVALNVRNLLLTVLLAWVIWPPKLRLLPRSDRGDVREAAN